MKKIRSLIAVVVLMLVGYASASACVCDLPLKRISLKNAVTKAKSEAAVVFSGQVVELDDFTVKFKVEQVWKGAPAEEMVMSTGAGKADRGEIIISDCAYRFRRGEKYLVYAYGSGEKLQTHKCTRTADLGSAGEDVLMLEKLSPRKKKLKASSAIGGKA
jgi:hypothetical protein